jgi:hypothetical protein
LRKAGGYGAASFVGDEGDVLAGSDAEAGLDAIGRAGQQVLLCWAKVHSVILAHETHKFRADLLYYDSIVTSCLKRCED